MNECNDTFVSTDIEADGRIPGINSMLSLGSVAFTVTKGGYRQLDTFEENLVEYPGAVRNPVTMNWWKRHPEAWRTIRENPKPAEDVMKRYLAWIRKLPGKVAFVGYPASYDFMFVFWYLVRFTGEEPFGHAALCGRTYAAAQLHAKSWVDFSRDMIPEKYRSDKPHDHTPLNDAIQQGEEFAKFYIENTMSAQ
ncbi:MAG: 3'-5' exoribonuclease [Candidatus Moranbacteria bacterium]|nr:3'-5' exoribonuclease [Candidatus Moranbacteria bacterium]